MERDSNESIKRLGVKPVLMGGSTSSWTVNGATSLRSKTSDGGYPSDLMNSPGS